MKHALRLPLALLALSALFACTADPADNISVAPSCADCEDAQNNGDGHSDPANNDVDPVNNDVDPVNNDVDPACRTDLDCTRIGASCADLCAEGRCVPDPDCAVMPTCRQDGDCPSGQSCNSGACVPAEPDCTEDAACAGGEICRGEVCREGCRDDDGCASGQICADFTCVMAGASCDDAPELAAPENFTDDSFYQLRVSALLDSVDSTCNVETWHNGNDATVRFTAPDSGTWLLWSRASQLWTFSVLESCDSGETALSCDVLRNYHGNAPFDVARGFELQLDAGESVLLVADGCPDATSCTFDIRAYPNLDVGDDCTASGREEWRHGDTFTNVCAQGTFCQDPADDTLSPVCVEATPPQIDPRDSAAYLVDGVLKLAIAFDDDTLDANQVEMQLIDLGGEVIPFSPDPPNQWDWHETNTATLYFYNTDQGHSRVLGLTELLGLRELPPEIDWAEVSAARVRVLDQQGLRSETLDLPIETTQPAHPLGESCDPWLIANRCATELVCIPVDIETGRSGAHHCDLPQAPIVESARVFVRHDGHATGIALSGTDANGDALNANFRLYDEMDTMLGERNAYIREHMRGEGGSVDVRVSRDEWHDLSSAVRAEVFLSDSLGLLSEVISVDVDRPAPISEGDACDPLEAFDLCPDGNLCDTLDPNAAPTCQPALDACPEDWVVTDLNTLDPSADESGLWSVRQDMAEEDDTTWGSCSWPLDAPDRILSFTAPRAGLYQAAVGGVAEPPPTIYARSLCRFPSITEELGCNTMSDYHGGRSWLDLELEEGEVIYLVVEDQAAPSGPRSVRLTVTECGQRDCEFW